jgi:tetratricopeptide (TPR) repeat protein
VSRVPRATLGRIARTFVPAIAWLVSPAGCKEEASERTPAAVPVAEPPALLPAPEVEIAGCEETLRTPLTCRVATRDFVLRLYVPGDPAPTVRVEPGEPRQVGVKPHTDGGALVELKVDEHAHALIVETAGAEPWRIALAPMPAAPEFDALHEEAAQASDAATLEALLPRVDAMMKELPEERRVDALRLEMLIEHQLGRADAAEKTGEAALDLALETGRVGAAIETAQVLAWQHLHRGDDAGARWLVDLQSLHAPLDLDATRRAGWHYYRGLLARQLGDLRTALAAFESAEEIARRLGDEPQELSAAAQRVILMGALGRSKEQREGIERVLELVGGHEARCEDALELDNVAWALLPEHGTAPPPGEVDALFGRVEALLVEGGPCDPKDHPSHGGILADVALGRGLAALGHGDLAAAEAALDEVSEEALLPAMPPWLHYARGLLALRQGNPKDSLAAAMAAEKAAADPGSAADPDPRLPWRLSLLRGHAHSRAGNRDAALRSFLEAERIVDGLVGAVGIDQGRESLSAQAQEGAAHAIELLLQTDRVAEIARIARRSRGRTFRPIGGAARAAQLDGPARERFAAELDAYRHQSERIGDELEGAWRLDRASRDAVLREHAKAREGMRQHLQAAYAILDDERGDEEPALSGPLPGELWLLWHSRPKGLVGIAITSDGVRAQALPDLPLGADSAQLAELLLRPFEAEIEAASSVLVLPSGPLLEIDFAALPWRDDVLVASRAVAWKLDVARGSARVREDGRRALVVGDPATRLPGLGRLPEASAEAEAVARTLEERGFSVVLRRGDQATSSEVMSAVVAVDLLHWAGHGRRGDDGWDSRLPLAGEAALDVRDVLALPSVPRVVVLTGCETGRTGRDAGAGGMHLAAGFLVSGSQLVVAANADVDDELARAFGTLLYAPEGGLPETGIDGVRRASLALRDAGRAEFTAFRAWVP